MSWVKAGDVRALTAGSPSLYYGGGGGGGGDPYVDRLLDTFADYATVGAGDDSELTVENPCLAMTGDGKYLVVGQGGFDAGGGNSGRVLVYKLASGSYSLVATLSPPAAATWFGFSVAIADVLYSSDTSYAIIVGQGDEGNKVWYFLSTGADTWDSGTLVTLPGGGATLPLGVAITRDGQVFVAGGYDSAEVYAWTGLTYSHRQSIVPSTGNTVNGVAIQSRWAGFTRIAIAVEGSFYFGVDVWSSTDSITWSLQQAIQFGITDGAAGNPSEGIYLDKVAISGDGRVIAAATSSVFRGGALDRFYPVGGVFIAQAIGTVLDPVIGTYSQTALLTGPTQNDADMGQIALSKDGQVLMVGVPEYDTGSPANIGVAYLVNRVQSLSGEAVLADVAVVMPAPYPTTVSANFGHAVAMNSNGAIMAVGGSDHGHLGHTTVRVFSNTLDDLLTGITNDSFANAITLPGGSVVANVILDPVKIIAASNEPDETDVRSRSLWWKITPSINRTLAFDVLLSATALDPFYTLAHSIDTVIDVFTGSSVDALTSIANGDDDGTPGQPDELLSAVTGVALTGGTTYHIRVACYGHESDAMLVTPRYSLA